MFSNTKCLLVTSSINFDVWVSVVIISKYGSTSLTRPPAPWPWWGGTGPARACWYNFNSLLLLIIDWIAFATVSKSHYIKLCSSFGAVISSRPAIYQAEIKPANVRNNKHRLIPLIQYQVSSLDNLKSVSKKFNVWICHFENISASAGCLKKSYPFKISISQAPNNCQKKFSTRNEPLYIFLQKHKIKILLDICFQSC